MSDPVAENRVPSWRDMVVLLFMAICPAVWGYMVGLSAGEQEGISKHQKVCVEQGYGEYVVEEGKIAFRFLPFVVTPKPTPEPLKPEPKPRPIPKPKPEPYPGAVQITPTL